MLLFRSKPHGLACLVQYFEVVPNIFLFFNRPPEEINSFERSSHFYERERDRRDGDAYLRRASSTYHVAAEPLRGRTRDRHYRNGPYTPIIERYVTLLCFTVFEI